jgi:RNA polymerase sigma factor (sigma-70 family)
MSPDPLEALLDKLTGGDLAAAAEVFRACEPLLRKIVRRQLRPPLRAKFDSADVVQSVWADLLHRFRAGGERFASAEHLRAFLVRATRNRFIDRCRRHRDALEHELPLLDGEGDGLPASRQPEPSEVVQADDLWDRMLALCPPEHHDLLRLKRQGLPLAGIAARTGLHEDSVRRVLRNLARRLALDRRNGCG